VLDLFAGDPAGDRPASGLGSRRVEGRLAVALSDIRKCAGGAEYAYMARAYTTRADGVPSQPDAEVGWEHIRSNAVHPTMRALARIAQRDHLSGREVARRSRRKPKNLRESFFAVDPWTQTIHSVGGALGVSTELLIDLSKKRGWEKWDGFEAQLDQCAQVESSCFVECVSLLKCLNDSFESRRANAALAVSGCKAHCQAEGDACSAASLDKLEMALEELYPAMKARKVFLQALSQFCFAVAGGDPDTLAARLENFSRQRNTRTKAELDRCVD
jgi:hypothetical protein